MSSSSSAGGTAWYHVIDMLAGRRPNPGDTRVPPGVKQFVAAKRMSQAYNTGKIGWSEELGIRLNVAAKALWTARDPATQVGCTNSPGPPLRRCYLE